VNSLFSKIIIQESELLWIVNNSLDSKNHYLITYLNQHCFNIYSTNKIYKKLLDEKFMVYVDGFGINLVLKFLFGRKNKKFNATDLNEKIMELLLKRKTKFFILGGNFNQKELVTKFNCSDSFVGYNKGFFLDSEFENVIEKIRTANPDVVIIGMGVPKQEIIAERLSRSINAYLFLCVGNFFEFYFGTIKRIPKKFRNKGIEWIYRFFQEPKRLWKRYFIGIPLFIFRVIRYKFSSELKG